MSKRPIAKMSSVRCATRRQNTAAGPVCSAGITKASALPTANRKNGNTRSVAVQPCHGAWASGGYIADQVPGLLTRIISATVAPRNTSSERKRAAIAKPMAKP